MKPESRTVLRRGSLDGTVHKMGFDPGATAHIMGVLTDLYKDRPLACLREYSTNALDAQIMAGYDGPIEVTLPTSLNPLLTIRDHGIGLDAQGIAEIYSQYGASTKRNSDAFNGMLGLGCKAALSYTAQFTVVGVKDGTRTIVAVSRDEDGGGDMTIVSEQPTDEPNGVTVQIPAKPTDDFRSIAERFYSYWKPGTVLVNGQPPKPVETTRVTDRVHTVAAYRNSSEDRDRIVMGGVAYPCYIPVDLPYGHSFVCYVNIGEVTFTPSREALRDTKRTKDTIEALKTEYATHVNAAAQAEVDAAATHPEALAQALKWRGTIPSNIQKPLTYRGANVPTEFKAPCETTSLSGKLGQTRGAPQLDAATATATIFVHGYALANFTATHKKKLFMAVDQHPTLTQQSYRYFALSATKLHDPWVGDDQRLDWEAVSALRLPTTTASLTGTGMVSRIGGSYDVIHNGNFKHGLPAAEFPKVGTIVYLHGNDGAIRARARHMATVGLSDYLLVALSANRIEKFVRDFPSAIRLHDFLRAAYAKWVKTIPANVALAQATRDAIGSHAVDALAKMNPARVDDPAIKSAIGALKVKTVKYDDAASVWTYRLGVPQTGPSGVAIDNPLEPYTLFETEWFTGWRASPDLQDHAYIYLNAAYAAAQKDAGSKVA